MIGHMVRSASKRWTRIGATAAALSLLAAPALEAQRIPAFELGLYGGGAWSSSWFGVNEEFDGFAGEVEEDGFGPGLAPIFGATASWYFTPRVGLRLHGGYMPSDFPTRNDDQVTAFGNAGPAVLQVEALREDESDYTLNNYFADLSLTFRPWIETRSGLMGSTYLFVGGGILRTDVAGENDFGGRTECVDAYEPLGACLPYDGDYGTVGQGTAGLGFNLLPLAQSVGLFGELAVHGYDSPVHTVDEDDPAFAQSFAEDRFAFTPRAVVGLKFAFGDLAPEVVPVPVAPAPRPAPAPAPAEERIRVCVVEGTTLTEVDALYLPAEGDTVVMRNGMRRDFADAYPTVAPSYAAGESWFLADDAVRVQNREYVKFGVPRIVPPTQLTRVADHNGVGLYAETGTSAPYQVLYIPLRPGCQFQPYQMREQIRVRG